MLILGMIYRAVIFDLDGTLLDTLRDLADSVNNVLSRSGFPKREIEAYKYFVGSGMRNTVSQALPENRRNPETVDKLYSQMEDEYAKNWEKHTHPYDGIPELLNSLFISNVRVAILTNKPQLSAEEMVSALLPQWHFEVILGAKPSIPLKPDPAGALQVANQMKLSPQEFVYLGDSGIDMETAVAAKMYAVGALWGFRSAEELISAGSRALIKQPADLLHIIRDQP
jgi:phosphoglycolate phosphatase